MTGYSVGLLLLCLSYGSFRTPQAQLAVNQFPASTVADSVPRAKSTFLLTVSVQLVDAETDTIVAGAHLSAMNEKSSQSYPIDSDQKAFSVSAPPGATVLIKASAPAYLPTQTRLSNLRLSQRIVMKLTHTRPSILTIKAFATDISQPLSPATAILTSLITGRSEPVLLQHGRIERRFTQPDKLTIQVSSPGYTPVSRQMTIEVPALGNRYEFDAELEKKPVERTVVVVDDPVKKIISQAGLTSNSLARMVLPIASKPAIITPGINANGQAANTASLPVAKSQPFGVIEKGKTIQLNAIYFDQSSPVLRPESHTELDQLWVVLNQNSQLQIEIRGHTDNQGDLDLNTQLSRDRCQSVINYLIGKGISKTRLKAVGRGPLDPIAPNNTEENRRKNRRVEFVVL